MNIGDLFFTFRGDGAKLQADAKTEGGKAGTSFGGSMLEGLKKSWSGANIGQGFVQGLGLAGGLGAVTLISGGIEKLVGIAGDAIGAFREDQVSIQALGTALRDNVANWDGNTDAIERLIKKRTALGFSDDEQRASLATLVTSTHDVKKGLELEAGAMDIARARHVDLATAADAVAKAYGGNTKGLKSLIPGLNLGKSSTEALANAFKAVQGAGEDFAKTDEGKVLVAQAKVNEAMEKLGSVLSGPVADGAMLAADALTNVLDELDKLNGAQGKVEQHKSLDEVLFAGTPITSKGIEDFLDFITPWDGVMHQAAASFDELKDSTSADVEAMRGDVEKNLQGVTIAVDDTASNMEANRGRMADALGGVSKATKRLDTDTDTALSRVRASWKRTIDYLKGLAQSLISDAFDPILAHDDLVANNMEVNAQKKILATKATTDAQKKAAREAQAALDSTMQSVAQNLVTLASAGQAGTDAFKTGLANLKTYAATLKGPAKASVDAVIAEIERIEHVHLDPIPVHFTVPQLAVRTVSLASGNYQVKTAVKDWQIYDRGGMVPGPLGSHHPAILQAGERVLTPEQAKSWGGDTFNVNLSVAAVPGATIQDARRQGQVILDVVAAGLREQTARRVGGP